MLLFLLCCDGGKGIFLRHEFHIVVVVVVFVEKMFRCDLFHAMHFSAAAVVVVLFGHDSA